MNVAVAMLGLSGCAMRGPLARVALEQNTLVARTTDEMMLTNILRARSREPMHFTSLSALHGNVSLSAETDLTAAVPNSATAVTHNAMRAFSGDTITGAASIFTPVFKGSVSTNPSFDLAVNDSQQFYQGFLAPLQPSVVAHFLDDAWPSRMLTYLLVSRFDFVAERTVFNDGVIASDPADADNAAAKAILATDATHHGGIFIKKDAVLRSISNDADPSSAGSVKFQNFVACYHLHATRRKKPDIELMPLAEVKDLANIDKLDGKAFDVAKAADGKTLMLVRKGGETDGLELARSGDVDTRSAPAAEVCNSRVITATTALNAASAKTEDAEKAHFDFVEGGAAVADIEPPRRVTAFQARGLYSVDGPGQTKVRVPVGVSATIRSTESLLYFLGEYSRYEPSQLFKSTLGSQEKHSRCESGQPYNLIVLDDVRPAKIALSASIHGKTWWVPDNSVECNGRTMEIIALVEQLYDLQKSSTDKIGTQSVRLIQ